MSGAIKDFRSVVALWKTRDALALEIGATSEQVRKWAERNSIPPGWWGRILGTDPARDAGLTAERLLELAASPRFAEAG